MAGRYKLRCSIFGHGQDVRSVYPTIFPQGGIVSGSRDITARVWTPNESSQGFTEGMCYKGHNNFVSCVVVMPPDDKYPQGLIITGSHDNIIHGYTLDSLTPVFKLAGHEDTVCSLASGKFGTLLSGSWDTTARVWLNQKCVMTLKGHEAAVWAVAIMPEGGYMLTASADKTIKLWRAGRCERTFAGHEDCVRGLAVLSGSEFLSCANDATVRRWSVTGECTHTYYGHENYIYSIAVLPNGEDFVTAGEDRSVRVWKAGECTQTITHPTQSVWSVCVLANGDIVSGASDAVIRVFTTSPERTATDEEIKAFEDQLANTAIPSQLGDLKQDQLPGPEALLNPGKRDGQNLIIKDGSKIEAYQWAAAEGQWSKVGDVVGGSGTGKKMHNGKEYDYVFDVDIQEDKPPLKLPFNTTEDPYMAAHNFLERNDISQMYLDQVAKFIIEQTKGVQLGPRNPQVSDPFTGGSRYVPGSGGDDPMNGGGSDPFTGAGRYVPTYSSDTNTGSSQSVGADPFTGASSYQPGGGAATQSKPSANEYFPKTSFISFDTANTVAILNKLKELNGKAGVQAVKEDRLSELEVLLSVDGKPSAQHLDLLWQLLQWPPDIVFPAIDILRMAVRLEPVNQHFFNTKDGPGFVDHLLVSASPDAKPANQMLAIRTLANSFRHSAGQQTLLSQRDSIITALVTCKASTNKNVHIAINTVLLNYAIAFHHNSDIEAKSQCLSAVATLCDSQTDPEALFRLLVCLGTLICNDDNGVALAKSLELFHFVQKCRTITEPSKVGNCARLLSQLL